MRMGSARGRFSVLMVLIVLVAAEYLPAQAWSYGEYDEEAAAYQLVRNKEEAASLPRGTTHIKVVSELADYTFLTAHESLTHLWLSAFDSAALHAVADTTTLKSLHLEQVNAAQLTKAPVLKGVQDLHVSGHDPQGDYVTLAIKFPSLQTLTLRARGPLQAASITALRKLSDLRTFRLDRLGDGSSDLSGTLDDEVEACASLAALRTFAYGCLTGAVPTLSSLRKLAALIHLRSLALRFDEPFDTKCLETLTVELAELRVSGQHTREDVDTFVQSASRFEALQVLEFSGEELGDEALERLSTRLTFIREVAFYGKWPTNASQCLQRLSKLRDISFFAGRADCGLTAEVLETISGRLESVRIDGRELSSHWVAALSSAKQLTRLIVRGMSFARSDDSLVTSVFARLRWLTLHLCTGLRSKGYALLQSLQRVNFLQLWHMDETFSGEYAETIAALPQLACLSIDCRATDEGAVAALGKSKLLTSLSVSYHTTIIPETVFLQLRTTKSLRIVEIAPPKAWPTATAKALKEALPDVIVRIQHID